MTGDEIRRARLALGMTITEFGEAIGFKGDLRSISRKIRRIEADQESLHPLKVETVQQMLAEPRPPLGPMSSDQ